MVCSGSAGLSMAAYKSAFSAMEVQSTFYRLPKLDTVKSWRSFFGEQFVFTMKAYQGITHRFDSPTWKKKNVRFPEGDPEKFGGLQPTQENFELWEKVIQFAKALKAEFVVVQLPPSFVKNQENLGNLVAFFGSVEKPFEVGVELRHTSWFEDPSELKWILEKLSLVDVTDPFKRDPVSVGDTLYFRLHGLAKNYSYKFTDGDLKLLQKRIEQFDAKKCYVFFNNVNMATDAKRFIELLA